MKISVIIPTYNCLPLLKITLSALEKQDLTLDQFEVIVVDDGSSDGTKDFLLSYNGALNLKPLINEVNLGRAKSRNRGIFFAKNELIVFLDADIEVEDDFLRLHREAQGSGPQISVGAILYHPDLPKTGIMHYHEKRGAAKHPPGAEIPGKYFISGNSSLPRSVLLSEGGFDESFTHYGGEDLELGLRLSKRLPLRSLPSAKGYHRRTKSLKELLDIVQEYGEHSLPLLFEKHPQMRKELGLEYLSSRNLHSLVIAGLCSVPVFFLVKLAEKLAFKFPFIYNYLIFRSYREGYLASQKSKVKSEK